MTDIEKAARLALEALEESHPEAYRHIITAIREALAEQPTKQRHIAMMKAVQEPEFDRVKFERHWRKTRGEKKANRELQRHPLQPQTYIQDSANRHWVTWQAAVRSIARPASKPWVGLTDSDREELDEKYGDDTLAHLDAIEAKLKEKNA